MLEFGTSDAEYLLLRVPEAEASGDSDIVPYLVLNGRIVPPIDVGNCAVNVEQAERAGARGGVDCAEATRAVFSKLRAWHFEQRSRVHACLSVAFQPRMLASVFGRISRSCRHCRQVTQIT